MENLSTVYDKNTGYTITHKTIILEHMLAMQRTEILLAKKDNALKRAQKADVPETSDKWFERMEAAGLDLLRIPTEIANEVIIEILDKNKNKIANPDVNTLIQAITTVIMQNTPDIKELKKLKSTFSENYVEDVQIGTAKSVKKTY